MPTTQTQTHIDDVRIREIKELASPAQVMEEFPASQHTADVTFAARSAIHRILHGADDRLLVVIGPCSIHDTAAAMEYAHKLKEQADRLQHDLLVVMRVYFEKPRTTVGWKGLINDPYMDDSFQINEGLRLARKLLRDINELGLPAGTEFLDMITPQYIGDLIAWGAIGARTTESQVHRQLASGLSCPVGFKNGTEGDVRIAIDAIKAAQAPHHFLSVTKAGHSAIVSTAGNEDCHIILRGGKEPNYDAASIDDACRKLAAAGVPAKLVVDFSHGNSRKQYALQIEVGKDIAGQLAAGEERIMGIMCESHLVEGRQDLLPGKPLEYGKSITDACIGWDATVGLLDMLAEGVRQRRARVAASE
ncbi:3-deoxy-7-phosphoheptulonate synthase AroG [Uliginosibacterium sp. H3]|uniref:Phospho-2-dehydro-3-deoxyheptonate aldolase n=1 Tax=Uliginosibacterium silvisoli TaxID=3114758 RepID=A0ABU6K3Y6_9RHOO|nr:3-deoxy-7-phosphoheptulonate synthase AroG [Uliginosibacterium sp. H3]